MEIEDEGTRVVRNASRNHYEPLRSAFGAYVGETTFIGNCNIMLEGTSDQILLGGAAAYLRARGKQDSETLEGRMQKEEGGEGETRPKAKG